MLDAKSKHLDCSPWLMITFLGFGLMLFMNAMSSFREEWAENASRVRNLSLIETISVFPFTSNFTSLSPSFSCRPSPPGGW